MCFGAFKYFLKVYNELLVVSIYAIFASVLAKFDFSVKAGFLAQLNIRSV